MNIYSFGVWRTLLILIGRTSFTDVVHGIRDRSVIYLILVNTSGDPSETGWSDIRRAVLPENKAACSSYVGRSTSRTLRQRTIETKETKRQISRDASDSVKQSLLDACSKIFSTRVHLQKHFVRFVTHSAAKLLSLKTSARVVLLIIKDLPLATVVFYCREC